MGREGQLVINNDPEVSCCFGWNKRLRVNIDIDVVVDDLFGWEDHQFRFGQVQLQVVLFHPCGYISKTVRDPRRDSGVLRRERQKQCAHEVTFTKGRSNETESYGDGDNYL